MESPKDLSHSANSRHSIRLLVCNLSRLSNTIRSPFGGSFLINAHSLIPHIDQTSRSHPPIILLDINLHTGSDIVFLACECISQFLQWNSRLVADQILVDGVVLEEVVGGIERAALEC